MTRPPGRAPRPRLRLALAAALVASVATAVLVGGRASVASAAGELASVTPARLLDTRTGPANLTVDGRFRRPAGWPPPGGRPAGRAALHHDTPGRVADRRVRGRRAPMVPPLPPRPLRSTW